MSSTIPILDLSPEIEELWNELQAAIADVLRSGHFIMGPNVRAFEDEVAQYLGVKHAIGVNSGTDALFLALRALGVGPGDEVITTAFTFFASAEAISHVGATPVFVDIDADTQNMDTSLLERLVTPRTKAIIPVHLFGHVVDMDPVLEVAKRYGLHVVEDVAQAFGGEYKGRKAGTLGSIGTFSFFPSKNLGAFGDAGMIVTNDDALSDTMRMLRSHGSRTKYHNELVGYNSRLDEMQAAILRVKLPYIDRWNDSRRRVADIYSTLLGPISGVRAPGQAPYAKHVFHQYTIRVLDGKRDRVKELLGQQGIGTMVYYPVPLNRLPVYSAMRCVAPIAEQAASQVLSLPIWPQLTSEAQERTISLLTKALS